ncbi:unnamed protein product [Durusdinium trenchii]|uniref:Uncharacterized protein n=2 Tax=Durusdinium trenchii TaxID=1381693 RepID=A0ABP0HS96_9DINO
MAHMCVHCSFNGERGKCERVGAHHAPYCPRFKGTCKYCGCKGGFECVAKEHGHHQSFCPRFRGECKLCGIKGSYEEIAMLSPAHNRFCGWIACRNVLAMIVYLCAKLHDSCRS